MQPGHICPHHGSPCPAMGADKWHLVPSRRCTVPWEGRRTKGKHGCKLWHLLKSRQVAGVHAEGTGRLFQDTCVGGGYREGRTWTTEPTRLRPPVLLASPVGWASEGLAFPPFNQGSGMCQHLLVACEKKPPGHAHGEPSSTGDRAFLLTRGNNIISKWFICLAASGHN